MKNFRLGGKISNPFFRFAVPVKFDLNCATTFVGDFFVNVDAVDTDTDSYYAIAHYDDYESSLLFGERELNSQEDIDDAFRLSTVYDSERAFLSNYEDDLETLLASCLKNYKLLSNVTLLNIAATNELITVFAEIIKSGKYRLISVNGRTYYQGWNVYQVARLLCLRSKVKDLLDDTKQPLRSLKDYPYTTKTHHNLVPFEFVNLIVTLKNGCNDDK